NEVCNHDKLSKAFEVQIILTANNEGLVAGRELLGIAPAVAAYVPKASTMSGLWTSMKDSLFVSSMQQTVEIKTDEDYTKIGEHIDEYRNRMEDLVRCSDVVYAAQRSQGYEMSRCGTFLSALAVHEREDQPMSHLVGNAGEVFEAVSNLYQDELDKLLALYVSNIRYLAGKVGAVKTVLTNREQAILEVHQASATMHRNKERFAAARASSGAAASAMIAEQKMVSAEDRMNLAKEQVDFIATSLKVEAKRLYLGKTEELKQSLMALATTNSEYHTTAREAWQGLLPLMNVTDRDINSSLDRVRTPVVFRKPGDNRDNSSVFFEVFLTNCILFYLIFVVVVVVHFLYINCVVEGGAGGGLGQIKHFAIIKLEAFKDGQVVHSQRRVRYDGRHVPDTLAGVALPSGRPALTDGHRGLFRLFADGACRQ
ncbi:hypothetical protein AaE_015665, partial [Aphanomyces astaci]